MSPRSSPRPPRLRTGGLALAVTPLGLGVLGHGLLLAVLACVAAATLVLLTAIAAIRVRHLPALGFTVALLALVRRGPGDLLGERAMLLVRRRSATAVALTDVHALVASAGAFNAFLDEHPHLVAVLERRFYDRRTHDAAAPARETPGSHGNLDGEFRAVLFADVVGFGGLHRTDTDRLAVRDATYRALRDAFERSGIRPDSCRWEDRGDGALIILPAAQPPHLVLHPLPVHLAAALRRHNRGVTPARRVRLRLALDIGPVTADAHGVNGTAIVHAARLLDAAEFKRRMAATRAELGVAVSGHVYDSVVRHAPGQVDPAGYRRIDIAEKETRAAAWVALSGVPRRGRDDTCEGRPPERRRPLRPGGPHR